MSSWVSATGWGDSAATPLSGGTAKETRLEQLSCATRIYLSTLHRRKWWVKGVKPNVPIIRNRYTILDIAPPAGSWALALSSALDTHQSLLTYTPRPAPRARLLSLSLSLSAINIFPSVARGLYLTTARQHICSTALGLSPKRRTCAYSCATAASRAGSFGHSF
jgi:hypothetical protein